MLLIDHGRNRNRAGVLLFDTYAQTNFREGPNSVRQRGECIAGECCNCTILINKTRHYSMIAIAKSVAVASIPDVAEATGEAVMEEASLNAYTHFRHLILDTVIPRDWVWRGNQGTDTTRRVVTGPIDLIPSPFPIPGSSL
jgi:hypothetical protein